MRQYRLALCVGLMFLTVGCAPFDVGAGASPSSQPTQNVTNNSTSNSTNVGGSTNKSTSNSTNNSTSNSTNADSNTNQTTKTSGTTPSSTGVHNGDTALSIVRQIYASESAKDPNLRFQVDHETDADGHHVYVVQVFDDMSDHTATIGWIEVRDDGLVQNFITQNGWVSPQTYTP